MLRRGFSLIEMLVVIAVSTVLMGVAIGTLGLLFRAEGSGRDHAGQAAHTARLADQFRSDVHAAIRPITAEGGPTGQWQLALPNDCTVTYRAAPGEMERRQEVGGKLLRRECYVIAAKDAAEIAFHADSSPPTATLVIRSPATSTAAAREIRIDAVLAKDHRFTKSPAGSP